MIINYEQTLKNNALIYFLEMFSRLLRCSIARGSGSGLSLVGSTKVKACTPFLYESSLKVEIKNTCISLSKLNVVALKYKKTFLY